MNNSEKSVEDICGGLVENKCKEQKKSKEYDKKFPTRYFQWEWKKEPQLKSVRTETGLKDNTAGQDMEIDNKSNAESEEEMDDVIPEVEYSAKMAQQPEQMEESEEVSTENSISGINDQVASIASSNDNKRSITDDDIRSWEKRGLVEEFTGESAFMIEVQPRKKEGTPESILVAHFCEINKYLEVCAVNCALDGKNQLHLRNMEDGCVMIDIRDAYQGSYIPAELRKYFVFNCGRKYYNLRRVHFGLRNAPLAMREFLQKDFLMNLRTNNKILMYDDCIACRSKVVAQSVREMLREWRMDIPEPIPIEEWFKKTSSKLKLEKNKDNVLEVVRLQQLKEIDVTKKMLRTDAKVISNDLVGSHPVGGKLRLFCLYFNQHLKKFPAKEDLPQRVKQLLADVVKDIKRDDPCRCIWAIPPETGVVIYSDGSYQGFGFCFYVGGDLVMDSSFINDGEKNLNFIELRGVIAACIKADRCKLEMMKIKTDSTAVRNWFDGESSELGIRNQDLQNEVYLIKIIHKRRYGRPLIVTHIPTDKNPADKLTRIQENWLDMLKISKNDFLLVLVLYFVWGENWKKNFKNIKKI